jgi:hypothetical protein
MVPLFVSYTRPLMMLGLIVQSSSKPVWLTALEISTLVCVSLLALSSLLYITYTFFRANRKGRIQLPGATQPPATRGEEFKRQILDNVDQLPDNDGEYVQEGRFWRTVS